ncbi:MAG: amidohydrolase, partial [Clostridioides sp.]|jgi:metal-dependent amidase/aminoacylase/carboxypeptidase family protein|nr:amidohydrolase [Clostridioides sp.]
VTFKNFANPLINNEQACDETREIAKNIFGEENIITNFHKRLGADDFADFLQETIGCYAFIGTKNKNKKNSDVAHHNGLFDLDEEALLGSCNLYVDYALSVLS